MIKFALGFPKFQKSPKFLNRYRVVSSVLLGLSQGVWASALMVEVQTTAAGKPLVMNRPGQITDRRHRALAVTRLDLLLSDLSLQRPDGTWTDPAGWTGYFRAEQPLRRQAVPAVVPGSYVAMRFAVGVPPRANHADPNRLGPDDPLHPVVNGLHWGWTGGYIFMALEGHWQYDLAAAGRTGGYSYHLAGDENRVTITLRGKFRVQPGTVLTLRFDTTRLLAGVDIARDGESTHSRQQDTAVRALKTALRSAFTLQALSSAVRDTPGVPGERAGRSGAVTATAGTPYAWSVGTHMPSVALPADNVPTVAGVALGQRLFHDQRLSRDGTVSCASCHDPAHALADPGKAVSAGVGGRLGTRNAMPLFNLAWAPALFWDGRVSTLRRQVVGPIEHPHEMADTLPHVVAKLGADTDMVTRFKNALGGPVTAERIGLALEQFMLTRVSQDSKFDRAMKGGEPLTPAEKRGFELFLTEHDPRLGLRGADCFHCHGGGLFTNQQFMNNGLSLGLDTGREQVTGQPTDRGKFRTPSLRNVAVTAPYMHDGRFKTLEDVIDHYDHGVVHHPNLDPNLAKHPAQGLKLSRQDKAALVAFLKTLTDPAFLPAAPGALDRSSRERKTPPPSPPR
jgi:cytochrome c peroxidase